MSEVTISKIYKEYGPKRVLDNISFTINKSERIGLIGRNGTGKTTIFRIITDLETPDTGEVIKRRGLKIGCLDQIFDYPEFYRVEDVLLSPFAEILSLKEELSALDKKLESATEDEMRKLLKTYAPLQQRFENLGGYEYQDEIKQVCLGLQISDRFRQNKFSDLSGGEQVLVNLAKILLERVDLLLLDEPTNHLDIEAVEWLEKFLIRFKGAVMVISHDRFFLDRVATRIMEIEGGRLLQTQGNYTTHQEEKEKRFLNLEREYKQQRKEIKDLEESIVKNKAQGKKSGNVGLLKKADTLQAKLDRIVRLPKPKKARTVKVRLNSSTKSSKLISRLEGVSKAFGEKTILNKIDLLVRADEKVAILGKNGAGKSTLLRIMIKQLEPDSGEVLFGDGNKVAYLDQDLYFENDTLSILNYLKQVGGLNENSARSILARFLFFKDDVDKIINSLSGGERTRLKLALLFSRDINTLILDEPTNHLDIESREALEEEITASGKTLIFISHDRYFIAKMAGRVLEIKDQKIVDHDGGYKSYLDHKYNTENFEVEPGKKDNEYLLRKKVAKDEKRRKTKISNLEKRIDELEQEVVEIIQEMNNSKLNFEELNSLHQQKIKNEELKDKLLEEWLTLSEAS